MLEFDHEVFFSGNKLHTYKVTYLQNSILKK